MATSKPKAPKDSKPSKPSSSKKSNASNLGAPAQRSQASRKGKRAWRKNVDLDEVEEGLEDIRAEERTLGKAVQKHKNEELFFVDTAGNEQTRQTLPRYSKDQLTSTKILAQRSAVPAVFSRPSSAAPKRKSLVSHAEKERLLRIGKRPRRGPMNTVMDPTEIGAGSALLEVTEAVKQSGTYDAWAECPEPEVPMGLEPFQKLKIKPPPGPHPRNAIDAPAIAQPHQGASYNPLASAHQDLLIKAHEAEERRVAEAERLAAVKTKMEQARLNAQEYDQGGARGMTVDDPSNAPETESAEEEMSLPKKLPERKTKAQRNKAAKLLAEKRALSERAARKRLLASIDSAKSLKRSTEKRLSAQAQANVDKQRALREKLRQGLAGQKLGKHKVPTGEVDVQLGEDLSESLRALKPEGNLFRDRFVSMQQRALIEPRAPVLPKKRRTKVIEYEKHAWKRFE
ncbi:hypothetical protein HGRIS_012199 [Hohenbuehelia grisea]|uniref:Ribosome biogenesis protein NOP53 n=1 Tax=Hohenbuehelia grisea TaxID=104357 RepID=A0ABR3IRI4_9AGAR